jgi:hypothetical protein
LLADTHFGDVPNIDYRFEQLGDFINDYFEIYFPWVFGTAVAWINHLLQEREANTLLPTTVPAYIRWGVNTSVALELMVRGIPSRSLAFRIAEAWRSKEETVDVRSWIRSMSLVEWQRTFSASVAELRSLLEFSRDQRGGAAVDLVTRESAKLEVASNYAEYPESDASLKAVEVTELSPIGIWVKDEQVGRIFTRDQADVQSLLDTGLSLSVKFLAALGKGILTLELLDPES